MTTVTIYCPRCGVRATANVAITSVALVAGWLHPTVAVATHVEHRCTEIPQDAP